MSFKLIALEVETQKEVNLALTSQSKDKNVKDQIIENADLVNPENGILLVLDVKDLAGYSSLPDQLHDD